MAEFDGEALTGYVRLTDADYLHTQIYVQHFEFPTIGLELIRNAVDYRCQQIGVHPVIQYLDSLVWDGEYRMSYLFSHYFDATANSVDYLQEISRCFLGSMVARIYDPGCKCDYMVVLEGAQGIGKSQACRILGGDWFGDNMPALDGHNDKDVSAFLAGKWLVEDSELASHNRGEINRLKSFLSRQVEDYRRPYAKLPGQERRSCVLIGTTNEDTYLRDTTGGRRFWPVKCGTIDLEGLTRDRDQLFAEAADWIMIQKKRHWPAPIFERFILAEQEARQEADAWEEIIAKQSDDWTIVKREDICEWLDISNFNLSGPVYKRIGAIMKKLGWERKRSRHERYWTRERAQRDLKDLEGL